MPSFQERPRNRYIGEPVSPPAAFAVNDPTNPQLVIKLRLRRVLTVRGKLRQRRR